MEVNDMVIWVGVFALIALLFNVLFGAYAIYRTTEAAKDSKLDMYDLATFSKSITEAASGLPGVLVNNGYVVDGLSEAISRLDNENLERLRVFVKTLDTADELAPGQWTEEYVEFLKLLIKEAEEKKLE